MNRVPILARAIGFGILWIGGIIIVWLRCGEREAWARTLFSGIFAVTGLIVFLIVRAWARRAELRRLNSN